MEYGMKTNRAMRIWAAMMIMLVMVFFAAGASALTNSTYGLEYETFTASDGSTQVKITGVTSQTKTSYTVPATLGGYPVTQIGYAAFKDCTAATNVTLPASVNTFNTYSFAYMDALKTINIPEGVTAIPTKCFYASFYDSDAEISLTLPSTVTSIASDAFTATYVDHYYLPDNCTSFTLSAFGTWGAPVFHCTVGTPVSLRLGVLGKQFLDGETEYKFLTDADGNVSLQLRALPASLNTSTSYTVTDTIAGYPVTSLYGTFKDWTALKTVELPGSVTEFAGYVFQNCAALEAVELPEALETMGSCTFDGCTSLKDFAIPASVTELGTSCFANCTSLTNMDVSGVPEVNGLYGMFSGCTALKSVKIPDSLTIINTNAFNDCKSLTSVNVPSGLTKVGPNAFDSCLSLQEFRFPRTLVAIEEEAFDNVPLQNVRIPASVTSIGSYSLNRASFAEFMLPEGLTYLGKFVFSGAENLPEYIILPESLTTLLDHAMIYGNEGYTFAVLEGSEQETKVQSLGYDYVHYLKTQIGTGSHYSYFVHDAAGKLLFFDRTSGIYTSRTIIPDGITAIADGVFENSSDLDDAFVVFPEGLTAIGANAFAGTAVRRISFPQSLTSIGAGAFSGIEESERIILSAKITSIGEGAFPAGTLLLVESGSAGETFAIENGNPYGVDQDGFVLSPDGKSLYHYSGSDADVVIPDGVEVIDGAFTGNTSITSVTLPASVKTIADDDASVYMNTGAFYGCTSLAQVTMNDGLVSIGHDAFSGCTALSRVVIPQGVTSIGKEAFASCIGMTEIEIPDSVTEIGANAFQRCYSLKRVELPSGLTTVSRELFMDTEPEYIGIPAGVTTIEEGAFQMCYVPSLYLPSGITSVAAWTAETTGSFEDQTLYCAPGSTTAQTLEAAGYAYSSDSSTLGDLTLEYVTDADGNAVLTVTDCATTATDVVVPAGVKAIADRAFSGCSSLERVTLPDGLETIGYQAFQYCEKLTEITIPGSVKKIGQYAFYCCSALQRVTLESGVEKIGSNAFSGCTALEQVTLEEGLTSIGVWAFSSCPKIREITIPASVTELGSSCLNRDVLIYCHAGSAAETYARDIGYAYAVLEENPVVSGDFVLVGTKVCKYTGSGSTSVVPEGVTEIGQFAFYTAQNASALQEIILPETLEKIGKSAFSARSALIQIPAGVTEIGDGAFSSLSTVVVIEGSPAHIWAQNNTKYIVADESLTRESGFVISGTTLVRYIGSEAELTIPQGVTEIGENAFYENTSVQSVIAPDGLLSVGSNAFRGCTALTSCDLPNSVTSIGMCAFYNCAELAECSMPDGLTQLGGGAFEGCLKLAGEMDLHGVTAIPENAFYNCAQVTSFVLSPELTDIGNGAFAMCAALTQLDLPDSVTSIGSSALMYTGITSMDIPQGVTQIKNAAFMNCKALKEVSIPASVTSIGEIAFVGCSALTAISLPEGLEQIADYAFDSCTGLTSVQLPSTLKSLGENAFYGCSVLTEIEIPGSVETMGYGVFEACEKLEKAVIGEGVKEIGEYAFTSCLKLSTVVLPQSLTSIGEYALYDGEFTELYLPGNIQSVGEDFVDDDDMIIYCAPNSTTAQTLTAAGYSYTPSAEQVGYLTIETFMNADGTLGRMVTGCDAAATDVVIPDDVTVIGDYAFDSCSALTMVTIPESVTRIGDGAFFGCSGLTMIGIPSGVEYVGSSAFADCTNLTDVAIYDRDMTFGSHVFQTCTSLTSITIPDSVTAIGDYMFYGCTSLSSVNIGAGVRHIGEGAFFYDSALMMLEIPASVQTIGGDAFGECYALTDVIVRSETVDLANTGLSESCMLYGYAGTAAQTFAQNGGCAGYRTLDAVTNLTAYSPDGTKAELAWDAIEGAGYEVWGKQFSMAQGLLATVTEPAYVQNTMYGDTFRVRPVYQTASSAIYGDYADVTVTYPEFAIDASGVLVKYGGEGGHVVIPDGVTAIGSKAFYGQAAVTGVTIPDGVISIGADAFYGTKLTELTLPDSVTSIGDYAFQYTPLTTLKLGENVTKIGAHAFRNTQLTTADLGKSLKTIGNYAFAYCAKLESVTLPDSVTSIGECAFYQNTSLTGIDFPSSLTTLGNHAFAESTKFKTGDLPDGVKAANFGQYVFLNCPLETVTIPADMGITTIGAIVYNPYNVKTLTVYDESINISWLLQNSYGATVYASTTSRAYQDFQNYGAAQNHTFVAFENFNLRVEKAAEPLQLIWDHPSGQSGVELYRLNDETGAYELVAKRTTSTMTDSGTKGGHKYSYKMRSYTMDAMGNYTYGPMSAPMTVATPGYDDCTVSYDSFYGYQLTGYTGTESVLFIPDHVQQVAQNALKGNTVITKVVLPESIEKLNYCCMAECPNLTEVVVPPTLKIIGDSAFRDCDIRSLTLPEGVGHVDYYAFSGNKNLTEVSLPQSLTYIAGDAFSFCESLESIDLPDALTWIGGGAFRECKALKSIEIPDSADLADYAFQNCTALETVKLPANLTALCNWEFEGCTSLTSLILPQTLSEIRTEALAGCTALTDLVILNRDVVLEDEDIEPVEGRTVYGYTGSTAETYAVDSGYDFVALDAPTGLNAYSEGGTAVTVSWFALGEMMGYGNVTGYEVYGADAADGEFVLAGVTQETQISFDEGVYAYYKVRPYVDVTSGRAYGAFTAAAEIYVVEYEIADGVLVRMYLDQAEVTVPDGVTAIGDGAFEGNANTQKIILPETVTTIGANAFAGCETLMSVNIPDGVTSIGANAFDGCAMLVRVILPDGVTEIDANTFGTVVPVCRAGTATHAAILNAGCDYTKIENGLYILCQNGAMAITGCDAQAESVVIPEDVTVIALGAFAGCERLTSVYIPEHVERIDADAFMGCTSLTEIAVMNRTAVVGSGAFSTGTTGRVIGYPDGGADEEAASAGYVFCPLVFDGTLSALWEDAVVLGWTADEHALHAEIWRAPHGGEFEMIAEAAGSAYTDTQSDYNSTYKLRRVYAFAGGTITGDFSEVVSVSVPMFSINAKGILTAYSGTDSDVLIPASVKQIAGGVFINKPSIQSVTMVSGLEVLGGSVFERCTALSSVILPDTLTTIGSRAFYSCASLASITLPDNVTSIGTDAFDSGTVIRCNPGSTTAQTLDAAGFAWRCAGDHQEITYAAVPATHKTTGMTHGVSCSACGLVIEAQQEIPMLDLKAMVLPAFLKTIGEEAFAGSAAEAIELPDTCTAIGARAFADCVSLQVVEIPASVTEIAPDAFASCRDDLVILTVRGSRAYTLAKDRGMAVVTTNPEAGNAITLISADDSAVSVYSDAAMTQLKATYDSGKQAMMLQYGVSSCMIYVDGGVCYVDTKCVK